jgi:hypothetical protein
MSVQEPWVCPTCSFSLCTPYCSTCGEKTPGARDLTLRGFFTQFFQAFSSIDRRVIRSFGSLLTRPGELTQSFIQGQRIPFVGPFQLFLVANLLFFALQSLTSTNIVSATLDSHIHLQDWSGFATDLVNRHLEIKQTTLELYTPIFNQALLFNAKTFIILMVVPFAVMLLLLFYRNQQHLIAHVVFSLYLYAFLLLLFCFSILIAAIQMLFGGDGLNSPRMDTILSLINLTALGAYLYAATGRVYKVNGKERLVKVVVLMFTAAFIFLGYKFLLFLITLYFT